jgi:uncharacterized protein (DUF305 family)
MRSSVATATAAIVLALVMAACGGNGESDGEAAAEVDGGFLAEMVVHHDGAIEMAEVAQQRSDRPQIRGLADAIIDSQSEEISQMEAIYERLFDEPLAESDRTLGMPAHEMGMDGDMMGLREADPFDRAFIDMMVPHHLGAIRMAQSVVAEGSDPEVRELAETIIEDQSREIEQMNRWREGWYGSPSPAGGAPDPGEHMGDPHEMMGH